MKSALIYGSLFWRTKFVEFVSPLFQHTTWPLSWTLWKICIKYTKHMHTFLFCSALSLSQVLSLSPAFVLRTEELTELEKRKTMVVQASQYSNYTLCNCVIVCVSPGEFTLQPCRVVLADYDANQNCELMINCTEQGYILWAILGVRERERERGNHTCLFAHSMLRCALILACHQLPLCAVVNQSTFFHFPSGSYPKRHEHSLFFYLSVFLLWDEVLRVRRRRVRFQPLVSAATQQQTLFDCVWQLFCFCMQCNTSLSISLLSTRFLVPLNVLWGVAKGRGGGH